MWERKAKAVIKDPVYLTAVHYHNSILQYVCCLSNVTLTYSPIFSTGFRLTFWIRFWIYCTARTWSVLHISILQYFGTWRLFPENTTAQYFSWICLCVWDRAGGVWFL